MLAKFPSNKRDKMKIAIVGATGNVGKRIVDEALHRGHNVTGIARDPFKLSPRNGLTLVNGDATDSSKLGQLLVGHDVVISSIMFLHSDIALLVEAVRASGVKRYLVVGGAGSLEVAPGKLLVDQPDFPDFVKAEATKGGEYLNYLGEIKDLDWTFLSPSALFTNGERTGVFRLGKDELLVGVDGKSWISYEDYAIALLDEIENPRHIQQRFTVGY
jgi:uncharacterized protein